MRDSACCLSVSEEVRSKIIMIALCSRVPTMSWRRSSTSRVTPSHGGRGVGVSRGCVTTRQSMLFRRWRFSCAWSFSPGFSSMPSPSPLHSPGVLAPARVPAPPPTPGPGVRGNSGTSSTHSKCPHPLTIPAALLVANTGTLGEH